MATKYEERQTVRLSSVCAGCWWLLSFVFSHQKQASRADKLYRCVVVKAWLPILCLHLLSRDISPAGETILLQKPFPNLIVRQKALRHYDRYGRNHCLFLHWYCRERKCLCSDSFLSGGPVQILCHYQIRGWLWTESRALSYCRHPWWLQCRMRPYQWNPLPVSLLWLSNFPCNLPLTDGWEGLAALRLFPVASDRKWLWHHRALSDNLA